jgi:serine/threonine protein kinase
MDFTETENCPTKDAESNCWKVMGEDFELPSKFKVVDFLGSGAYGVVCAVYDRNENCVVAIKKCKKIFQSRTLAKRTLREIRILRQLNHLNIVQIKSILEPRNLATFSELYIVFEIMETDLAQIIRSTQSLKDEHVQYFTYQLLCALEYLHAESIVHRDIK